jgi:hypothetical protein
VRRRIAALTALVLACAGAFAACGLDESGLMNGGDSSLNDVTQQGDVVQDAGPDVTGFDVVQLSCDEAGTPVDASCLGTTVPPGWSPVAYRENAIPGCDNAPNFQVLNGINDASVPPGQCVCSDCKVVGSWTCTATLGNQTNCDQATQNFTSSGCYNTGGLHFGGTLARSGDAGCTPGSQVDASVAATPVTACVPTSCSADFCGLVGQGFQGCIQNLTMPDAGCPSPFTTVREVAPSATPTCTCPACGLTNSSATCSGQVTALAGANCTGLVVDQTRALDSCTNTAGYVSVYYEAGTTPTPACSATGVATGTATLNAPLTICCK